jgi:hypothetical protein
MDIEFIASVRVITHDVEWCLLPSISSLWK